MILKFIFVLFYAFLMIFKKKIFSCFPVFLFSCFPVFPLTAQQSITTTWISKFKLPSQLLIIAALYLITCITSEILKLGNIKRESSTFSSPEIGLFFNSYRSQSLRENKELFKPMTDEIYKYLLYLKISYYSANI